MTTRVPDRLAESVKARAAGRCEYCHAPQVLIGQAFHVDHITPPSASGRTDAENLCLACAHCNIAKSDQTEAVDPRTSKRVRLFHPRTDVWYEHFRWSRDYKRLIGRTSVGRATIVALDMNARLLQEARYFWHVVGLIP